MDLSHLKIAIWQIERLAPYAKNARTHSDRQVRQIAASIREFGFVNPILVDRDGGIIAGHGRLLAAKSLDLAKVPVIVLGHLSEAQRRALVLADNKLALNAGWDEDLLCAEFFDLKNLDFDIGLTGFDSAEMVKIVSAAIGDHSPNAPDEMDEPSGATEVGIRDRGLLFRVIVECASEAQQTELLDRFHGEGLKCKALIS